MSRSTARADVAELSAILGAAEEEDEHHLVTVGTKRIITSTQFKQMFYSRGDDFFQIANVYECPDRAESVRASVWGINVSNGSVMPADNNARASAVYNFNKLGGRENDPEGCLWAYSYVHDQNRNFYAQHEIMGYLEKDTCIKKEFWTACSRMSIEDQLYGLAFASESDQDVCMEVKCARRWSEVEDALVESCVAAHQTIEESMLVDLYINVRVSNGHPKALDTIVRIRFTVLLQNEPSHRGYWNTRASKASEGVINEGVRGDAPEGGKDQNEDTSSS